MTQQARSTQLPLFGEPDQKVQDVVASSDLLSEYLEVAHLIEFADRATSWEIEGSNAKLSYLTHGFFRYFGKFPPPVASKFIHELHDPKLGPVIDPMVGSGTTLVEALIAGRQAIGFDVNPLSALIAKVKVTAIQRSAVLAVLEDFYIHIQQRPIGGYVKYIPNDRQLDHWFFEETQHKIAWTRLFIEECIEDTDVRDLFRVALASNIRRFSRATNSLGRMFLDPALEPQDVYLHMQKKLTEMSMAVEQLMQFSERPQVRIHDAMTSFEVQSTNLVICHPPYFNLYKYSSIYKYELLWLGFDYLPLRRREIREGFKLGKESLVHQYVDDLGKVIQNIEEILVPGGWFVLMMGDTVIHDQRVNTTALTCQYIRDNAKHLQIKSLIVRQPKFTEASYAAAQRRDKAQVGVKLQDHLIVLQRKS